MLKALAIIAAVLALAVGVIVVLAAMKPDTFSVTRSTTIKATPETIYPLIADMHRFNTWNPYEKKDPSMKGTYSGPASGKGAAYGWESKEVGTGSLEVTGTTQPSNVAMRLDFVKPFEAHNAVDFTLVPKGDATEVTWTMSGPVPFMAKIMHVVVNMDRMVGDDFPIRSHDFGKDIIPYIVKHGNAVAHHFSRSCVRANGQGAAYWRDVGTLDAYWSSNIDLTDVVPELDLYDQDWPIWTFAEITPPAKFVHRRRGPARPGGVVAGFRWLHHFRRVGATVAAVHGRAAEIIFEGRERGHSTLCEVERSARLCNVIIDRGVKIPAGLVVGEDPELDAQRFRRTDNGICLITQPMIDRLVMTEVKVLAVVSEIYPVVKTGGLADVAGALPLASARARHPCDELAAGLSGSGRRA